MLIMLRPWPLTQMLKMLGTSTSRAAARRLNTHTRERILNQRLKRFTIICQPARMSTQWCRSQVRTDHVLPALHEAANASRPDVQHHSAAVNRVEDDEEEDRDAESPNCKRTRAHEQYAAPHVQPATSQQRSQQQQQHNYHQQSYQQNYQQNYQQHYQQQQQLQQYQAYGAPMLDPLSSLMGMLGAGLSPALGAAAGGAVASPGLGSGSYSYCSSSVFTSGPNGTYSASTSSRHGPGGVRVRARAAAAAV
jgi:hypothetical protein